MVEELGGAAASGDAGLEDFFGCHGSRFRTDECFYLLCHIFKATLTQSSCSRVSLKLHCDTEFPPPVCVCLCSTRARLMDGALSVCVLLPQSGGAVDQEDVGAAERPGAAGCWEEPGWSRCHVQGTLEVT